MSNINIIHKSIITVDNINSMKRKEPSKYGVKWLLSNELLDQSQCIRFGKVFETFIKNMITHTGYVQIEHNLIDLYNTGSKTKKGKKELDICFIKGNDIYYFECKCNLQLDSEKSKETDKKVSNISKYLKSKYKDMNVYSGLLTGLYEIEKDLIISTKTNLLFIKDLFKILGITCTKEEYYDIMKQFGKEL